MNPGEHWHHNVACFLFFTKTKMATLWKWREISLSNVISFAHLCLSAFSCLNEFFLVYILYCCEFSKFESFHFFLCHQFGGFYDSMNTNRFFPNYFYAIFYRKHNFSQSWSQTYKYSIFFTVHFFNSCKNENGMHQILSKLLWYASLILCMVSEKRMTLIFD